MTEWEKYCLSKEADVQKMFPNANLKNPKTFTDKLQWLKIHDSTFTKAFCADKITLREFCKEKILIVSLFLREAIAASTKSALILTNFAYSGSAVE